MLLCRLVGFKAGRMVKLLMGFSNNGEKDFIVESMEASFRYPQDYSFFIQNVSRLVISVFYRFAVV